MNFTTSSIFVSSAIKIIFCLGSILGMDYLICSQKEERLSQLLSQHCRKELQDSTSFSLPLLIIVVMKLLKTTNFKGLLAVAF